MVIDTGDDKGVDSGDDNDNGDVGHDGDDVCGAGDGTL